MNRNTTAGRVVVLLVGKFGRAWLILSCLACLDLPAQAATKTWDANGLSPPSGIFNVGNNWNVNTVPTNLDAALFNLAQNYTVVFDNSPTNNDLTVSAGNVTFTGSSGARTYSLTDASGGRDATVTGGSLTLGTAGNPLHLTIGDDLRIRGGAILTSKFGSDISTVDLFLGDSTAPTGNGTLIVDGVGSSLAVSASAQLGTGGQTGLLVVRNGATADFNGTLGLADASSSHFSNGILSVESGGVLTTANIRIGTNATNGQTGTFSVGSAVGTSTVTQDANATLVVGATLGGPTPNSGTLNINSGGRFNSGGGTGSIRINPTGTINIAQGGVLNANGDVTIKGGVLEQLSPSVNQFNLAAGRTMLISNGGRASFAENPDTATNGNYEITGAGSKLETTGALSSLSINHGATMKVSSGGLLSSTVAIDIGTSGNGTLSVDGSGSSAVASSSSFWGNGGGTADVTFASNAIGTFGGAILMAHFGSATTANVNVLSGADLRVGNLLLAFNGGLTTSATLNVQGSGSTVTQTGASNLTAGESSGTAAINIGTTASGAVFTTGTGLATINQTGTVTIGSGANTGTLNANGNVTIDGGVLQRNNAGSTFNLASGKTMTIQDGGRASFTGDYTTAASAIYNINGISSKLETVTGLTIIGNGATVNVNSGGLVSSQFAINIGTSGNGTLLVDGSGSSASAIFASFWGTSGAAATVTFSNNATGTLGGILLARDSTPGTTANVNVVSGADLSVGSLFLATDGGATTAATLNVQGSGSTATIQGIDLIVGHATSGTAAINIGTTGSGAVLTTISDGLTTINKTGTLSIGGGANDGTFNANGDVTIDGGVLQRNNSGSTFALAAGKTMTIQNNGRASFAGGYGTANSAIYNISGANSKLEAISNSSLSIANGAQVNVSSGGLLSSVNFIDIGSGGNGTLVVDGSGSSASTATNLLASCWGCSGSTANVTFSNNAVGTFPGEIEMAVTATAGTAANVNILSGADLTVGNLTLATNGGATTSATLNVNGTGSTITQNGASTLTVGHSSTGTAAINIGTTDTGGTLVTGTGAVNIRTTGTVTIGSGANTGTLDANGNVAINGGTINLVAGTLDANTIALTSGAFNFAGGTLHVDMFNGNLINQGGTLAPGHSAGNTTIVGSYTQQSGAALEIEIGGLSAGGDYDLVGVTGNAILGGEFQLALIEPFVPAAANTFTVLNATGIFGVFSNVTTGQRLTTVDGIGSFLVHYGAGSVFNNNQIVLTDFELVALAGDYNLDGVVDAADYVVWRKTDGTQGGYETWRANFGEPAGGGSLATANATVPEPATLVMLIVAAVGIRLRRRLLHSECRELVSA